MATILNSLSELFTHPRTRAGIIRHEWLNQYLKTDRFNHSAGISSELVNEIIGDNVITPHTDLKEAFKEIDESWKILYPDASFDIDDYARGPILAKFNSVVY